MGRDGGGGGGGLDGWMEKRGVGGGGLRLGFTGRMPRKVQPYLVFFSHFLLAVFYDSRTAVHANPLILKAI